MKGSTTKGVDQKTSVALKGTKRGASIAGREVSKRGKVANAGTDEIDSPAEVDASAAISKAKSSKSNSKSRPSHRPKFLKESSKF